MSLLDLAKYRFDEMPWELEQPVGDDGDRDDEVLGYQSGFRSNVLWATKLVEEGHLARVAAVWYIECSLAGAETLRYAIEIDPARRGGLPVLYGTGFTVSQVLAELAETSGVDEVAENFELDREKIKAALNGISLLLQRPFTK